MASRQNQIQEGPPVPVPPDTVTQPSSSVSSSTDISQSFGLAYDIFMTAFANMMDSPDMAARIREIEEGLQPYFVPSEADGRVLKTYRSATDGDHDANQLETNHADEGHQSSHSSNSGLSALASSYASNMRLLDVEEKSLSDNEKSNESLVFASKKILSNILSSPSFTVTDLKYLRLVSRQWKSIVTDILLERQALQIRIKGHYFGSKSNYTNQYFVENIQKTKLKFEELFEIIAKSDKFPCQQFQLECDYLSDSVPQQFFNDHGSKIQRLELISIDSGEEPGMEEYFGLYDCSTTTASNLHYSEFATLKTLLTQQAQETEHFKLNQIPDSWVIENKGIVEDFFGNLILPKLRILELPEDTPIHILKGFLESAVNLEHLYIDFKSDGEKMPVLNWLLENKKFLGLLRNLNLNASSLLQQLLQTEMKLFRMSVKSNTLSDGTKQETLSRLLQKNSESLEVFTTDQFSNFDVPILPKLKKFVVNNCQGEEDSRSNFVFLKELEVSNRFPCLESVTITEGGSNTLENVDASIVIEVASVKKLEISFKCDGPPESMQVLPKLFPNSCWVKISGLSTITEATRSIWGFSKLTDLDLGYCGYHKVRVDDSTKLSLDSLFTGISSLNCAMYQNQVPEILAGELAKVGTFREFASVVDVKDLRRFRVRLEDKDASEKSKQDHCLLDTLTLSFVAGVYGFAFCPQLNVNVAVEYVTWKPTLGDYWEDSLKALGSYVHLDPW